ncbi:MAG: hypothetical protein IJB96_09590 [Lachnospira sp.]|nr:hypothetical protein [Lachnospira sp.]
MVRKHWGSVGSNWNRNNTNVKNILATTVSPKNIAMYSAKVTAFRNIAFTSCLRTIVAGTASNGLNMYRKEVTGSAL